MTFFYWPVSVNSYINSDNASVVLLFDVKIARLDLEDCVHSSV